jgi:hypothetical protein
MLKTGDPRGAEIDGELYSVKRVLQSQHLGVDEVVAAAGADARDVCVVVDEAGRVHVIKSPFDEVGRLDAQPVFQLLGSVGESPSEKM